MPTAHLDSRFSTPGAGPVACERVLQGREEADLHWVVTVRADSRPYVTPLLAVALDDVLHVCTAGAHVRPGLAVRGRGRRLRPRRLTRGDGPGSAHVFAVVPRSAFGKGEPYSQTRFTFPSGGGAWGHPRGSEGA
jgi:hypothetical protein